MPNITRLTSDAQFSSQLLLLSLLLFLLPLSEPVLLKAEPPSRLAIDDAEVVI
jgi:hypothetical protein